jgi:ABC-type antimicrobial peptide transport system permease subunit
VIGEDTAARYFPGGSAIGRRFRIGRDGKQPWITVIGIVPSLAATVGQGARTEIAYLPFDQMPFRGFNVLASTSGDPVSLGPGMRTALSEVSAESTLANPNSLERQFWGRAWAFRLFGGLFLTFGVAALVLAAAGLYGVMSFTVRRRTQELGVRMALGASRRGVLGLVLWQGAWRVAVGVVLGIWPAYLVGGRMTALLANVTPGDPAVYVVTVVTLLAAGVLACVAPALRAASVDPLTALRRD